MANRNSYPRRAVLKSLLLPGTAVVLRAAGEADVAVVARPDLPANNLSLAELRRILLGDRQFWTSNLHVTLLMPAPGVRAREIILKNVYQMSEAQFRQYWIAKVFRAEAASSPRTVYSNEMTVETVSSIPGAIAFLDGVQVPRGLKVIKIDGALPGDRAYRLR
jgi:hypothetical protein